MVLPGVRRARHERQRRRQPPLHRRHRTQAHRRADDPGRQRDPQAPGQPGRAPDQPPDLARGVDPAERAARSRSRATRTSSRSTSTPAAPRTRTSATRRAGCTTRPPRSAPRASSTSGTRSNPKVVSNMRLAVNQPAARAGDQQNDPGAQSPVQGYAGHYCAVPQRTDPKIVACSFIASGLRVFNIEDPVKPREIAYFNGPVAAGRRRLPLGRLRDERPGVRPGARRDLVHRRQHRLLRRAADRGRVLPGPAGQAGHRAGDQARRPRRAARRWPRPALGCRSPGPGPLCPGSPRPWSAGPSWPAGAVAPADTGGRLPRRGRGQADVRVSSVPDRLMATSGSAVGTAE